VLYKGYLDAKQLTHANLILDLTQDTNDGLRLRTNIFLTDYPPVVYSDIGDEGFEIKFPRPSRAQQSRTEIT